MIAEFFYNNFQNINTSYTLLELNYSYKTQTFFKNKYNIYSKSFSAHKLATKLRKLMNICYQNLLYTQDLQKKAYNKGVKPLSYELEKNV